MSEFDEIKKLVETSNFDGYKAAFLGAMAGWEKSMHLAVKYIKHLTGTGFDSEQHYWVHDCETCAEIAKFVRDWEPANDVPDSRGAVEHTLAGGQGETFCSGHAAPVVNGYCFDCGLPRRPAAKA